MEKVRALIVDDSVVYRTQIRAALQLIPWVEIVATAANGYSALNHADHHLPDLIILDLEMPGISGVETLRQMESVAKKPKVIIFSSYSKKGAAVTLEALQAGACDFVTKPNGETDGKFVLGGSPAEKIRDLLLPKMQALFPEHAGIATEAKATKEPARRGGLAFPKVIWDLVNPEVVVLGASTGGPTVLEKIFMELRGAELRCPIIVVQHMPPLFTSTFAERLKKVTGLPCAELSEGEPIESGRIHIAPGDFHLRLNGEAGNVIAILDRGPQVNSVRPAIDILFQSASEIYGDRCLGIILTGMGQDGRAGCEDIKRKGGAVVIQDEASCVVYGMPNAVFQSGAYDRIANPNQIVDILKDKAVVRSSRQFPKKVVGD